MLSLSSNSCIYKVYLKYQIFHCFTLTYYVLRPIEISINKYIFFLNCVCLNLCINYSISNNNVKLSFNDMFNLLRIGENCIQELNENKGSITITKYTFNIGYLRHSTSVVKPLLNELLLTSVFQNRC